VHGGRAAEHWGGKWVCGLGLFVASIATILIPVGLRLHISLLFILRFINGLSTGLIFSSLFTLFENWIPKSERTTALGFNLAGGNFGPVYGLPLVSYLCDVTGWEFSFYVVGIVGCLWFILWAIFVTNKPQDHRWISEYELNLIKAGTDHHIKYKVSYF